MCRVFLEDKAILNKLKTISNYTFTENNATTHRSTCSDVLDLFSTAGALRGAGDDEIWRRVDRAWAENPTLTLKTLFYARDVRGGLGERRLFRVALRHLADLHPESVIKNMALIPEYGRFDDLLSLLHTKCEPQALELICNLVREDQARLQAGAPGRLQADSPSRLPTAAPSPLHASAPVSLLGKWLPSINASCNATRRDAKLIADALDMRDAEYRKLLSALRAEISILENNLRERDYSFDYAKVPSKALYKYRKAYILNDGDRYKGYLDQVTAGKAGMHTATLTPYDVLAPFVRSRYDYAAFSPEEEKTADVTWHALEDFTGGDNALVVVDGSGSMYGQRVKNQPLPAAVAQSLGIYFAERNTGAFRNHFITFSTTPRLVEIKGKTILDKLRYCETFNKVADTNLQKVFELILAAALAKGAPQAEMPSTLYIISDMEFNACTKDASLTNFEYAKKLFERHGYTLPQVVFWNVNSRNEQQPVTKNEEGVILVSGCNPRLFGLIMNKTYDYPTPYQFMLEILSSERYEQIKA